MKIAIVGPGAIGTFLAGILGKRNEVDLLGRRPLEIENVEIIGKTEVKTSVNYTCSPSDISDDDLIIICTKAFDTEEAVSTLSKYISDPMVLSLQNGLNNERVISGYVKDGLTIGGITTNGVTFLEPGKVKHAGKGDTIIGKYPEGINEYVERVSQTFNEAGVETKTSDHIMDHIWEKAVVNSGINPLTSVLEVKNGLLIEDDHLNELLENIILESGSIAEEQVETSKEILVSRAKEVAKNTSDNFSSMLQDIKNESRTEIDQINGEIINKGRELGLSTQINETLFNLIKFKESTYLE